MPVAVATYIWLMLLHGSVIACPAFKLMYWWLASPTKRLLALAWSFCTRTAVQAWVPREAGVLVAVTWPHLGLSPLDWLMVVDSK